jgi:hypothetical protein
MTWDVLGGGKVEGEEEEEGEGEKEEERLTGWFMIAFDCSLGGQWLF